MSRDPNRIPIMLSILRSVWEANPDLRLAQLIMNCQPLTGLLYNIEDEELARRMYELYVKEDYDETAERADLRW